MKAPDRPGTRLLTALTVAGFALELLFGDAFAQALALWPLGHGFLPWQLLTYAFLHGSLAHLAFNLLGLWMFGRRLEERLGSRMLLKLYLAGVVSAAAVQLLASAASDTLQPTIGASGGVFGLLLAYALCFPDGVIMLLIPPLPLPARLAAALFAGLELLLGVTGSAPGIAHFAHLGGMGGAYLVLRHRRASGGA